MLLNWALFFGTSVVAYVLISLFGQLTAAHGTSLWQATLSTFRPLPFVVIILANAIWAGGAYLGFKVSPFAIPIALSIGVLTAFVYSLLFLNATFTLYKLLGVVLVLGGIYLLG